MRSFGAIVYRQVLDEHSADLYRKEHVIDMREDIKMVAEYLKSKLGSSPAECQAHTSYSRMIESDIQEFGDVFETYRKVCTVCCSCCRHAAYASRLGACRAGMEGLGLGIVHLAHYLLSLSCHQDQQIKRGEVYAVSEILDKQKGEQDEWLYLVKWTGYKEQTWEIADDLMPGARYILSKFNEKWSVENSGRPAKRRKKRNE